MLKIKLSPIGKKNAQYYRVVVTEAKSKNSGRNLAVIGRYFPLSGEVKLDKTLAKEWMVKGAQPTDRIRKLLDL